MWDQTKSEWYRENQRLNNTYKMKYLLIFLLIIGTRKTTQQIQQVSNLIL
jgi:hypothetical protein